MIRQWRACGREIMAPILLDALRISMTFRIMLIDVPHTDATER